MIGKKDVTHALICSKTDGTVFAATADFKLQTYDCEIPQEDGSDKNESVNEAANMVMLMKGGAKPPQVHHTHHTDYTHHTLIVTRCMEND